MDKQEKDNNMHICAGLLAHVDAGKTTLSEAMLYRSGSIRNLGRVDHQNAFLDYDELERNRGITIYAKQAALHWKQLHMNFVDTPGHVDFSAEMERTLAILDYAILIISGSDGVQAHTETIWQLLKAHQIPTFVFVNKMDISYHSKEELLKEMNQKLDSRCIDFMQEDARLMEDVSMCDDALMEAYLTQGVLEKDVIKTAIAQRKVFPCYFGSALKLDGIDAFLDGLKTWIKPKQYGDTFGARIYKISHDEQGNRLAHVKVSGGVLKAKMKISDTEKVDQLRRYSGNRFEVIQEALPGEICVIKGIRQLQAGDGLGFEEHHTEVESVAAMNYRMVLPANTDAFATMRKLIPLMEEDPQLHITYSEMKKEIRVQLMGEVQMEILKYTIAQRLGLSVTFDEGMVNYKETIEQEVEGVGHYEPLRHYAEVHLLLEPLAPGSGIQVDSIAPLDKLDRHWQRLILNHIQEKEHLGVLSGSPITDMKITLLCGKAHLKHTEGGDFRQATYRAIRQGLMKAKSVLLEPYYRFHAEVAAMHLSRLIYDLESMKAHFSILSQDEDICILEGEAPVACMQSYQLELRSYTGGKGKLSCFLDGYRPCQQAADVISQIGYDAQRDLDNPSSSIFCMHGSGYQVSWDKVEDYMHLPLRRQSPSETSFKHENTKVDEKELQRVFESIYGKPKDKKQPKRKPGKEIPATEIKTLKILPECLLVDGYNIIYDWDELRALAKDQMDAARDRLIDKLNNYQGYRKCEVILVFDAYRVKQSAQTIRKHGNIHVVYTKTSQTADNYIEMATHKLAKEYRVRVATSDGLEQLIVIGQGAQRISAREFQKEVEEHHRISSQEYKQQPVFRHQALTALREQKDVKKDK